MAAPAALAGMMAVSGPSSGVEPIGFVTWFSVPDRPVSLGHLKLCWLVTGLDPTLLPSDPRELFLFKRAMREQEGKVTLHNGTVIETDVREVVENADLCVYQVTRVVRDAEAEIITFERSMSVTYHKEVGEIQFAEYDPALAEIEESIRDYLTNNAKAIDGRKVRAMVRQYLKGTHDPTNMDEHGKVRITGLSGENLRGKGGGVYFVKAQWKKQLGALAETLGRLYPDNAAYLYFIDMVDDKGNKQLIEERFVANALADADEAILDVAKLLRDDRKTAIRKDVREHWFKKLMLAQARVADYEDLLKGEVRSVKDRVAVLQAQVEKLV